MKAFKLGEGLDGVLTDVLMYLGGPIAAWKVLATLWRGIKGLSAKLDAIPTGEEFLDLIKKVDQGFDRLDGHLVVMDQKIRMSYDLKHVAVFEFDASGSLSWVNSFFSRMTGLTLQSCLGSGWLNAVHPSERDAVAFEWRAAREDGRDFIFRNTSFQYIATGTAMPANMRFVVLRGEGGEVVGWQGWAYFGEDREEHEVPIADEVD